MDVATPPARTGPLITLWSLRIAVTAHLVAVLAQPVLAGRYLTGDVDAITAHGAVGTALAALDLLVIVAAALYVVVGRGRLWVLPAAVALFLAVGVQIGMGFAQQLAVHVPLGVGIVTASVLLAAWAWTPADSDGWSLDLLLPVGNTAGWARHGMVGDLAAGEREHRYPSTQRATTLWYHDHRMDFTGPAVYFGLAGFHLLRDDVEDARALPRGPRELPLMICDRAFAADRSFAYPALDPRMREVPGVEPPWMAGVSATSCSSTAPRGRCARWTPPATGSASSTRPTPAASASHCVCRAARTSRSPRSARTAACSPRRSCGRASRRRRGSGSTWWSTSRRCSSAPR